MNLICGLLSPGGVIDSTAERARSLTVSWLRWGYFGQVIECDHIDAILNRAAESMEDYCLIASPGCIISEQSGILGGPSRSFFSHLEEWTAQNNFFALASGRRCVLVNLTKYRELGNPNFADCEARLQAFPEPLETFLIDLGIDLTNRPEFLDALAQQAANGARGVFVLNFESYADVEEPDSKGPVHTLYSVAAGLKPNRILETHGFDAHTRVVYFDYSSQALRFRQLLISEWNGRNYPDFLRTVFKRMPYPETHYFLWPGAKPNDLDWAEMESLWLLETNRWGGENAIEAHWSHYRELKHDFFECNILNGYKMLLEHIENRNGSVIWWSNAFSTIYSANQYSLKQKQEIYEDWIEGLAAKNPTMLLYGSDHSNSPVNHIDAREYLSRYRESGGAPLDARHLYRHAMRF